MKITDALVQDSNKTDSPLSLLGVNSGQKEPNLLTEVLDGNIDPPGYPSDLLDRPRNEGFEGAKRAASKKVRSNFLGNPLEAEEAVQEEIPLEKEIVEEEPEEKLVEEIAAVEKTEEEVPAYFMALNHQYQSAVNAAEDASRKAEETQRYMKQYLEENRQPKQPEQVPYEQYGFESPDQYIAFRDQIKREALLEMQKANLPILQQLVTDKFSTAVARMESQHEHWKEYFPANYISNFYNQVTQNYGVDYLAKVNWEAELSNAYRVKDYERLASEYTKLKQSGDIVTKQKQEVKQSEKEERKNNLKLVPKASQKGSGSAPASSQKEGVFPSGKRSKIGFDSVRDDLKAQLKSQYA